MDPVFIGKEKIASLLPMNECIDVMEKTFRSMAKGECLQPLRSLMRLPDKTGLLGMMPGYTETLDVMGIKVISVFHANREAGFPSHQGVVILFDAKHGQPLLILDAFEITAIRTAATSALATRVLARENSELLAVIGSGEQAERHIEAMLLVRKIKQINLWSRNEKNAVSLSTKISERFNVPVTVKKDAKDAVEDAGIICAVTASQEPVVMGDWLSDGAHVNAVGACTPITRELDTAAMKRGKLFTDCYESIFNEAGDFLIPKKEGALNDSDVRGELGEVLEGIKKGRENDKEITIFKSVGAAYFDLAVAKGAYVKAKEQNIGTHIEV
jgi:ornithine cyclodeaminase